MNVPRCIEIFQELLRDNPTLANIALLDPQGVVQVAALPLTGNLDMSDRTSFKDAMRSRAFSAGDFVVSRMAKVPVMQFSYPVIDAGEKLIGVLFLTHDLEKYKEYFNDIALPQGSRFVLLDRNGVRLMERSWQIEPPLVGVPIIAQNWRIITESENDTGQFTGPRYDGVEALFHFRRLRLTANDPPYMVVYANIPLKVALSQANQAFQTNLLLLTAATLLAVAIIKWLGHALVVRQVESLRENEQQLGIIIDSLPSAVIGVDAFSHVIHFNRKAQELFGKHFADVLGLELFAALPRLPFTPEEVHAIKSRNEPLRFENATLFTALGIRLANIALYPLKDSSLALVVIIEDITERVRLEGMMVQTEKMMSLGGLAAGMAHEINNPLGGILLGVQVLQRRLQEDTPPNRMAADEVGCDMETILAYAKRRDLLTIIESMRAAAVRAAKIVHDMLSFSRQSDSSALPEDMTELLDSAVDICSNDYDLKKKFDFRHIKIVRAYQPGLPSVRCVRSQIEQVFVNLMRNAAQAMNTGVEDHPEPTITLTTRREDRSVVVEIQDNGPGMDEATRKRIFEPFFTTKAPGIGTGLGLSVSYFIMTTNHKGSMEVESGPGRGARFIIRLPIDQTSRSDVTKGAAPI